MSVAKDLGVVANARDEFRKLQLLVERALEQVDDAQFFAQLDSETNSIAVTLQHLAGNLRSRWTDFLTTDGEKPDRNREAEFVLAPGTARAELEQHLADGWAILFAALDALHDDDLSRTVTIRGEPHSVLQAIHRQLTHYGYHVGQVVLLARHAAGAGWVSLSVPRGASATFNARMSERFPR